MYIYLYLVYIYTYTYTLCVYVYIHIYLLNAGDTTSKVSGENSEKVITCMKYYDIKKPIHI